MRDHLTSCAPETSIGRDEGIAMLGRATRVIDDNDQDTPHAAAACPPAPTCAITSEMMSQSTF